MYTGRSGRGGSRQSVRRALDAASADVHAPVQGGRRRLALSSSSSASVLEVLGPLLTKVAVDKYLAPPPSLAAGPSRSVSLLQSAGGTRADLPALPAGAGRERWSPGFSSSTPCSGPASTRCSTSAASSWTHLQKLDVAFFDHNPVGRLVTRVTTDVDVLNDLFASGLVTILGDLLMLSFVVVAMFKLSVGLTLMLLAVTPLVIAGDVRVPPERLSRATAASARDRQDQRLLAGARQRHRGVAALQPGEEEPAKNSSGSTAITWRRTRTRSSPTAGSTRWSSSSACWRWRCCWLTRAIRFTPAT